MNMNVHITVMLGVLTACASTPGAAPGAAPASGATPTPASGAAPTPGSVPAPAAAPPPATGGSVLIGDIASAKSFDPKPVVVAVQQQLLDCYNKARGANPELRGKLRMRVVVNDAGVVVSATPEPGDLAKDDGLTSCISDVAKATHFPKPGGMATVTLPLLFRP
jgi:hypothetical protein